MEVAIDKFGRILIPKKVRQLLGLRPGQKVELVSDTEANSVSLIPKHEFKATLTYTDSGIRVFQYSPPDEVEFDVVELLRQNREERNAKISGQ